MNRRLPQIRSRGTPLNPTGRFEPLQLETSPLDASCPEEGWEPPGDSPSSPVTRVYRDPARRILTRNRSPDVGFEWSLNPYRGCEHGCVYCYARPTHEYLGFSAGLDFETRILARTGAGDLLRRELAARSWKPRTIVMSGVTDPYQPVETRLGITRECLQVLTECRHPVALITKSNRILRDLDLLGELAGAEAVHVTLSLTTLDRSLQRALEPRASSPERRLEAVRGLADAGIPVAVNLAPIIPGLTDHEIPTLLQAAAEAGATGAGFVLLRLPHGVKDLFSAWLEEHLPDRAERVLNRIRDTRDGALYRSPFGTRMRGTGPYARHIEELFQLSARRFGLEKRTLELSAASFRPPTVPHQKASAGQLELPFIRMNG